jgi:hypothetical protein
MLKTLTCLAVVVPLLIMPAARADDGNAGGPAHAEPGAAKHTELGDIHWMRDFDKAVARARAEKKPLLVLFQEVPGCATCQNYGQGPLSHPLIVEAAETLFVPVAVFNNKPGADETVLKSFKEPAWNNPVVRIIDADRKPLSPRIADQYSTAALAAGMIGALRDAPDGVPEWLQIVGEEEASRTRGVERATFAMHCFWEGEQRLGAVRGVVATTAGFHGGAEVVEVEFDPAIVTFDALLRSAMEQDCATHVVARSNAQKAIAEKAGRKTVRDDKPIRPDKEPKYHLGRTPMRFVPMTAMQAMRVNAAIHKDKDPAALYLSPRQRAMLRAIASQPMQDWPERFNDADFAGAWKATRAKVDGMSAS